VIARFTEYIYFTQVRTNTADTFSSFYNEKVMVNILLAEHRTAHISGTLI